MDMVQTLQHVHLTPRWGYMRLNDACLVGGGIHSAWSSHSVVSQSQPMVACFPYLFLLLLPPCIMKLQDTNINAMTKRIQY